MTIGQVLDSLAVFTAYIAKLQAYRLQCEKDLLEFSPECLTRWDYVVNVFGPTPALYVHGELGRTFFPLQAVTVGWHDCHDLSKWLLRPLDIEIRQRLGLTQKRYNLLIAAESLLPGYNRKLRSDLIASLGLPAEPCAPYFCSEL